MRWSNVLLIAGFGVAAYSSTSSPEYGQWNTDWMTPAWSAVKVVPDTVGRTYAALLQNSNKALYGGEKAPVAAISKVGDRNRGCIPGTISDKHSGVAISEFQILEKMGKGAIGKINSKDLSTQLKASAFCQLSGTQARWLIRDGTRLDVNFSESGMVKGWRRDSPKKDFQVLQ